MTIPAILRAACSAQGVAIRAWTCSVEGALASTAASAFAPCTCGCVHAHLGVRWLSHLSHQRAIQLAQPAGQAVASCATCSGHASQSFSHSTRLAALQISTSATAAAAAGHAQRERLEPAADIPSERRAKLADELETPGASGTEAAGPQGRRDRRPQRGARDGSDDVGSSAELLPSSQAGMGLPDDAEVQAVFDKIVGNLTKSGRKATARRIVLDAMRIMRGHLRKGDLDKIK